MHVGLARYTIRKTLGQYEHEELTVEVVNDTLAPEEGTKVLGLARDTCLKCLSTRGKIASLPDAATPVRNVRTASATTLQSSNVTPAPRVAPVRPAATTSYDLTQEQDSATGEDLFVVSIPFIKTGKRKENGKLAGQHDNLQNLAKENGYRFDKASGNWVGNVYLPQLDQFYTKMPKSVVKGAVEQNAPFEDDDIPF